MAAIRLQPADLCLTIDPGALGFADTSEIAVFPLPWIGQERAEQAARFGLSMDQPDYNLFVLGEVGSGRSSLLQHAMQDAAASRPAPPDLCYLYNFDAPEHPRALRLPAGQGRLLRHSMGQWVKSLLTGIPRIFDGQEFKTESERIEERYKDEERKAYAALDAEAESRHFALHRESGHMVFTYRSAKGHAITEEEMLSMPREQRARIEAAEQELRGAISRYFELIQGLQHTRDEAVVALRRQQVKPLLEHGLQEIRAALKKQIKDTVKLNAYFDRVEHDLLENVDLFKPLEVDDDLRQEALIKLLSRYRVNLLVDNDGLSGAPVIVEDNPLFRSLFGSIEYQSENDVLVTDFARIRAGSLHKAHGGFLLLHLRDLIADGLVWEKLRRFLRSSRLQIEEPGTAFTPIATVSLEPEAVDVDVKIVLIGSRDQYYELQEADPEFARRFRVKVDFAESFSSSADTRRSTAIFIAHTCQRLGLPHFSAAAVARLLEDVHREVDDQSRQSANFARLEALVMESAGLSRACHGGLVETADVDAALAARTRRHDYPEQRMQEAFAEGDLMISVAGSRVGRLNGLTQIDLGEYRFGFPVAVSARTHAGEEGLLNIEREVEMSGPIHDKGVFILHSHLSALFAKDAPLALNAAIVFEQEYYGVEGDSASCAELFAVLSALSGVPLKQGMAVTGAINQHGEVMPVGGINEKIEGFFRVCEQDGLDGSHGVIIPQRNRRHLMLDRRVTEAVEQGLFHIHTMELASDGLELLTGLSAGQADSAGHYPLDSVLGRAQSTLRAYRRACHESAHPQPAHRKLRSRAGRGSTEG